MILAFAFAAFYADIKTDENIVFLTFDDGPSIHTPQILKTLDRYGIKAVFFVEGNNVKKYPDILKKILDEGHTIGNHTMNHINLYKLEKKLTERELKEKFIYEVKKCEEEIFKVTGTKPKLLRIPHGYSRKWAVSVASELGYTVINWSFGYDWHGFDINTMLKKYMESVKNGCIILMHDTIASTSKLLPKLIENIKQKNYGFGKLEDFIKEGR